jgi:hypothetical protein
MIDAVSPEALTPQSTIVAAYERCLDDESLFGKIIECSADKQFFLETPSLANGQISKRAVTVWDPLFKMWVSIILRITSQISSRFPGTTRSLRGSRMRYREGRKQRQRSEIG